MNGNNDDEIQDKAKDSTEDDSSEEKEDKERSGLRVLPKSDLESLKKRFPGVAKEDKEKDEYEETQWGDGLAGQDDSHEEYRIPPWKETKREKKPVFDINKRTFELLHEITRDMEKLRIDVRNDLRGIAKSHESLIFDTLKTGLDTVADVERTEGGGIRVTRPPKDKRRGSSGMKTEFKIHVNHDFHKCVTCGDEIGLEFYVIYDLSPDGTTIRVFDTDQCRSYWVKNNRAEGIGWSDDVTTIRNLAYGYYASVEIPSNVKVDIGHFIDWIAEGAGTKDSQPSLIIGPGSGNLRFGSERVKTLEEHAEEFMKVISSEGSERKSTAYSTVVGEFIEHVKCELKKDNDTKDVD